MITQKASMFKLGLEAQLGWVMYLMAGPVPTDVDEMGFDMNADEVFSHSIGACALNQTGLPGVTRFDHLRSYPRTGFEGKMFPQSFSSPFPGVCPIRMLVPVEIKSQSESKDERWLTFDFGKDVQPDSIQVPTHSGLFYVEAQVDGSDTWTEILSGRLDTAYRFGSPFRKLRIATHITGEWTAMVHILGEAEAPATAEATWAVMMPETDEHDVGMMLNVGSYNDLAPATLADTNPADGMYRLSHLKIKQRDLEAS